MSRAWIVGSLMLTAGLFGGCLAVDVSEPRARPGAGITVWGTGKVAVVPDTALAHLGVELRAPSLSDATAQAARQMQAVLERLKTLGVSERDITTVAYSVDPVTAPRRSEDEGARIAGYRVVNVVQVRIRELTAVGRLVEAAMAAGATTIRGVRFRVSDPARAEAEARALAVRDAQTKAGQLAEAAGLRLGELVSLTDGGPLPRPELGERFGATVSAAMAPGPVEPGQLEITVSVTAHYRLARQGPRPSRRRPSGRRARWRRSRRAVRGRPAPAPARPAP
ncbi:MAG TPA: SIMPL domain-containing protein [Methylomirabilota bacterium]|nr:SIMPL domain-containing protein [Methylomirabilota bacterium]